MIVAVARRGPGSRGGRRPSRYDDAPTAGRGSRPLVEPLMDEAVRPRIRTGSGSRLGGQRARRHPRRRGRRSATRMATARRLGPGAGAAPRGGALADELVLDGYLLPAPLQRHGRPRRADADATSRPAASRPSVHRRRGRRRAGARRSMPIARRRRPVRPGRRRPPSWRSTCSGSTASRSSTSRCSSGSGLSRLRPGRERTWSAVASSSARRSTPGSAQWRALGFREVAVSRRPTAAITRASRTTGWAPRRRSRRR